MYSAYAADTSGWAISPGQHKVKSFKIEHCHFILFSHVASNTKLYCIALTDAAKQLVLYVIFTLSGLIIIFALCLSGSIRTRSSCSVILVIISFTDKKNHRAKYFNYTDTLPRSSWYKFCITEVTSNDWHVQKKHGKRWNFNFEGRGEKKELVGNLGSFRR